MNVLALELGLSVPLIQHVDKEREEGFMCMTETVAMESLINIHNQARS